jgi:predicted DCC family thiol-disulfide oxidoreductase YuxK
MSVLRRSRKAYNALAMGATFSSRSPDHADAMETKVSDDARCRPAQDVEGLVRLTWDARSRPSDLLIFDGTCGFCTWAVARMNAGGSEPAIRVTPYQWLDDRFLAAIGTTRDRCATAVHFVDSHGMLSQGADAINALLLRRRAFVSMVRVFTGSRTLLAIERRCYAWIASHRTAISGFLGTRRCALLIEE